MDESNVRSNVGKTAFKWEVMWRFWIFVRINCCELTIKTKVWNCKSHGDFVNYIFVILYHIVSSYLRCNLAKTAIEIKASLAREPEYVSKWFQLIHHENPIESKVSIIFYQTQDQGDFYLLCMISQSFDTFFVFEENHNLVPLRICEIVDICDISPLFGWFCLLSWSYL